MTKKPLIKIAGRRPRKPGVKREPTALEQIGFWGAAGGDLNDLLRAVRRTHEMFVFADQGRLPSAIGDRMRPLMREMLALTTYIDGYIRAQTDMREKMLPKKRGGT